MVPVRRRARRVTATPTEGVEPRFVVRRDPPGVVVVDPVEHRRYSIDTEPAVELSAASVEDFHFPVETAVTVAVRRLTLPEGVMTVVRDVDGDMLADLGHPDERSFPAGEYLVELSAPVKLYLRLGGPVTVETAPDHVTVAFEDRRSVAIGARSHHERPATTVTTTGDPEDVMAAVSTFGSALQTTGPERAWPSLRGHPPRVEVGDALSIPDGVVPPETDVAIEVPAALEYVYPVASLAYYLGATVRPGPEPRLVAGGASYPLAGDGDRDFEDEVARVLRQTLLFDCAVRNGGYYELPLREERLLADRVDGALDGLYDAAPAERLSAYLSVPYDRVADVVPRWTLSADCTVEPATAELLPYLANDLAVVGARSLSAEAAADPPEELQAAVEEFFRGPPLSDGSARGRGDELAPADGFTRGPPEAADALGDGLTRAPADEPAGTPADDAGAPADESGAPGNDSAAPAGRSTPPDGDRPPLAGDGPYVTPSDTDAMTHVWAGSGRPLGAEKLLKQGVENGFGWTTEGETTVTVVCNEAEMEAEFEEPLYGDREAVPFEVRTYRDLATDELRALLAEETDFLHYIGHAEADKLVCPDGALDLSTLPETGVRAFLLNGCRSYEQGVRLVEAGSVGGVVTTNDVGNAGAVGVGRLVARLSNRGFPLRSALAIAKDNRLVGSQYVTVGDGSVDIAMSVTGEPGIAEVERVDDGVYTVELVVYPGRRAMGAVAKSHVPTAEEFGLASGSLGRFELSLPELQQFLEHGDVPYVFEEEFHWPEEYDG